MSTKLLSKFEKLRLATAASLVLLVCACGRPATEQECREILRTAALLELQARLGNQQLIEAELRAIETSMEATMMEKCVGKRITEEKLSCIRQAKASEELFGKCF
jgi:hypothetical protein